MNNQIIPKNSTIIIGFSGGPDSIYLLLQLKKITTSHNINLVAAHLDHQWHDESFKAANWCQNFCKKENITFISKNACEITISQKYNGSKEEFARNLRRKFFEQVSQSYANSYIALAHHQDDQLETFFIKLARGASLSGLTGIKQAQGKYIKPLIGITKNTILTYLQRNNVNYLEDKTNNSLDFLRNRIRHILIPNLDRIDNRLKSHTLKTMNHLEEVDHFLHKATLDSIASLEDKEKNFLNRAKFLELSPIIQQRIILQRLIQIKASFTPSKALFNEIVRFLQSSKSNEHTIHATYKIVKRKSGFSIMKR